MSALILALLNSPVILAVGGGIVAALVSYMRGRISGGKRERDKQAAEESRARAVADEIDNDVGALPPDLAKKELQKWSRG